MFLFNLRDQVSQLCRTTVKSIVLYIRMFFESRRKYRSFWMEWKQSLPELSPLNFLLRKIDLLLSFPNIRTMTHFQMICLLFFITILTCILVTIQQRLLSFSYILFLDQRPYYEYHQITFLCLPYSF
jgi:hypothetical protein